MLNLQQNRIGQRGIRFLVDATKENDVRDIAFLFMFTEQFLFHIDIDNIQS